MTHLKQVPVVETSRLILHCFELNNVEALHAIHRDPEVMKHTGGLERFSEISMNSAQNIHSQNVARALVNIGTASSLNGTGNRCVCMQ